MTQQAAEILLYQDIEYKITTEPLRQYLKLKGFEFYVINTACWRGYVGKWKIDDNKLYLTSLYANLKSNEKVGLDFLFPREKEVFADWFCESIWIPQGEIIGYISNSYFSTPVFEESIILTFENGSLVSKKTIKNVVPEYEDLPF